MADRQELFDSLVDLGRAVGELGVAFTEAQAEMDRAALGVAAQNAVSALPSFRQMAADLKLPEKDRESSARRLAEQFARERTAFYAMPQASIEFQTQIRVSRSSGGILRMLVGGSKTTTQESTGAVKVTLAAVPASPALEQMIRQRSIELQRALMDYLTREKVIPPNDTAILNRFALVKSDLDPTALPDGAWDQPGWKKNLLAFKKVWNRNSRDQNGETVTLEVNDQIDRRTMAVLDKLSATADWVDDPASLEAQARMLLAALSEESDVKKRLNDFPRDKWSKSWGEFHLAVIKKINQRDGSQLPEKVDPTTGTVQALRTEWESGKSHEP